MAWLAAARARRSALGYVLRSPFHGWRFMVPRASQVLLIPQDLRTTDASFVAEVQEGHFGLAGQVAQIWDVSPFKVRPPSPEWEQQLHSFVWLRHLRAGGEEGGHELAREFVEDWIALNRVPRGRPFEPATTARRIMSWLGSAAVLLDGVEQPGYDGIMRSLDMQLQHLAASYRDAPDGTPRLTALTALIMAGLCIADQELVLETYQEAFTQEIDRQILAFGGHVSRNPGVLVDVLMDFLPMSQCYKARNKSPPEGLHKAIERMLPWLRYLRLGDGQLVRFHGMGATAPAALATVLAYDESSAVLQPSPQSGYLRLQAAKTIVVMDAGPPPPLELSSQAHAGCLSFEMSAGLQPLIVNCGAPGLADQSFRTLSRATTAHSTLSVNGASSSRLVPSRLPGRDHELEALTGPAKVDRTIAAKGGSWEVQTWHDGYLKRFGLGHARALRLDVTGDVLDGMDRLAHPDQSARIKGDVAFGIHFHLHPSVECRLGATPATAELRLPNGDTWRLALKGPAEVSIEESRFFADASGPRQSVQIVLRGRCLDSVEVHWRLSRVNSGPPLRPVAAPVAKPDTGEVTS